MILVGLSICATVIVLNIHFRSASTHKMSKTMRLIFLQALPKLLMMKRPDYQYANGAYFESTFTHSDPQSDYPSYAVNECVNNVNRLSDKNLGQRKASKKRADKSLTSRLKRADSTKKAEDENRTVYSISGGLAGRKCETSRCDGREDRKIDRKTSIQRQNTVQSNATLSDHSLVHESKPNAKPTGRLDDKALKRSPLRTNLTNCLLGNKNYHRVVPLSRLNYSNHTINLNHSIHSLHSLHSIHSHRSVDQLYGGQREAVVHLDRGRDHRGAQMSDLARSNLNRINLNKLSCQSIKNSLNSIRSLNEEEADSSSGKDEEENDLNNNYFDRLDCRLEQHEGDPASMQLSPELNLEASLRANLEANIEANLAVDLEQTDNQSDDQPWNDRLKHYGKHRQLTRLAHSGQHESNRSITLRQSDESLDDECSFCGALPVQSPGGDKPAGRLAAKYYQQVKRQHSDSYISRSGRGPQSHGHFNRSIDQMLPNRIGLPRNDHQPITDRSSHLPDHSSSAASPGQFDRSSSGKAAPDETIFIDALHRIEANPQIVRSIRNVYFLAEHTRKTLQEEEVGIFRMSTACSQVGEK